MTQSSKNVELATFGAGCFWCTEAIFRAVRGVTKVVAGYAGGTTESPTYAQVSSGHTGHAEVAQISFDPSTVSFAQLVEIFFLTHNPTTRNRQGNDIGSQYRSVIFFQTPAQQTIAHSVKNQLEEDKIFDSEIVTEIEPLTKFWPAENYHQQYYANNPNAPYCQAVIDPKIAKLRQKFAGLLTNT